MATAQYYASPQAAAGPPPLPTRSAVAKPASSGMGMIVLLVVLLVAGVGGYFYYTRVASKGQAATAATAATPPPPPPLSAAEKAQQMEICEAKGITNGICQVDPASNAVYAKCNPGYYGSGCLKKCPMGGLKATVYTPGYEGGSPNEATCKCPSTSHFQNDDVDTGCELTDVTGDACTSGWHGEKCDQSGTFKACSNGTMNSSGGCTCNSGFQGSQCQYPKDYCTKKDAGATFDESKNPMCVCSTGYAGSRCERADQGYYFNSDGVLTKEEAWYKNWTEVDPSSQITFKSANNYAATCGGTQACQNGQCSSSASVCDVITKGTDGQGCQTVDNLCLSGVVPSSSAGTNNVQLCAIQTACGWGFGGAGSLNKAGWLTEIDYPKGVSLTTYQGDGTTPCPSSSSSSTSGDCNAPTCKKTNTPSVNAKNEGTVWSGKFGLNAGYYIKCNGKYYRGATTTTANLSGKVVSAGQDTGTEI